jgi:hypothetical protein
MNEKDLFAAYGVKMTRDPAPVVDEKLPRTPEWTPERTPESTERVEAPQDEDVHTFVHSPRA